MLVLDFFFQLKVFLRRVIRVEKDVATAAVAADQRDFGQHQLRGAH